MGSLVEVEGKNALGIIFYTYYSMNNNRRCYIYWSDSTTKWYDESELIFVEENNEKQPSL